MKVFATMLLRMHAFPIDVQWFWAPTSVASRAQARSMKKTHSYRTAGDGVAKMRCSPFRHKHRNNVTSVKVFAAVGRGEVLIWEYIENTNDAWPDGACHCG